MSGHNGRRGGGPLEGVVGVNLTAGESTALARRLVALHVLEDGWLDWGNVPELSERAFDQLERDVTAVGVALATLSSTAATRSTS